MSVGMEVRPTSVLDVVDWQAPEWGLGVIQSNPASRALATPRMPLPLWLEAGRVSYDATYNERLQDYIETQLAQGKFRVISRSTRHFPSIILVPLLRSFLIYNQGRAPRQKAAIRTALHGYGATRCEALRQAIMKACREDDGSAMKVLQTEGQSPSSLMCSLIGALDCLMEDVYGWVENEPVLRY